MRVGQPKPEGSLTGCCPGVIGSYAAGHSDFDVDAALVQLDPGLEYRAEIEELGIVTGTHVLTQAEVDSQTYPVRKRGARTGKTGGVVVATDVGQVPPPPRPEMPLRHDIRIAPNDDPANPGVQVRWSDNGDSGAAVINDANEVVGIHFFGTHGISVQNGWGTAFPIADLLAKFFQQDGLDLKVATATATGQTKDGAGRSACKCRRVRLSLGSSAGGRSGQDRQRTPVHKPLASQWRRSADIDQLQSEGRNTLASELRPDAAELSGALSSGSPASDARSTAGEARGRVCEKHSGHLRQVRRWRAARSRFDLSDEYAVPCGQVI